MLSAVQMKSLKQVSVSKDVEKTRQRMKEDFSSASNADKSRIVKMSGQVRNSFYRVFNTGSANARLVLAMSYILNVSPFYYTGEEDIKQPLQDAMLLLFLQKQGYHKLLAELGITEPPKQKRPYNRKSALPIVDQQESCINDEQEPLPAESEISECQNDALNITLTLPDSLEMQKALSELDEDHAILLLRGLLIRAKASGQNAQIADIVKRCLLI